MIRRTQTALLLCGVLSSMTYVATDLLAGNLYPEYSFTDQAVSELFAIGAPTSNLVVFLFTMSSLLLIVFALGVRMAANDNRTQRVLAVMLFVSGIVGLVLWRFFPMHMRGDAPTLTDTMHLILATNPFVLLSVVTAAVAFKGPFRLYSIGTILLLVAPASIAFSHAPALAANEPTPGLGLTERISQYGYHLWQVALAVLLLRQR